MKYEVKILRSEDQLSEYEKLFEMMDYGNFFQSVPAFRFFKKVKNYDPVLIIVLAGSEIVGGLLAVFMKNGGGIRSYFSRRCIIWGGPWLNVSDKEIPRLLLTKLNQTAKSEAIYTEFRNFYELNSVIDVFTDSGYEYEEHLNYIVEINSYEDALKNLSTSKKRQINKSLKSGAEIINDPEEDQVRDFYNILVDLYSTKVKKPLVSYDFFKNFYLNKNLGKYLLIKYNNKIIGGIMCPIYKETIYEWFVCGLDSEYKELYPSVLATWAPIDYAAKNGLKYFDFMGAGKPTDDYGVRDFKSKFGGKLVNYGRYVRVNNKLLYSIGKMGLKLMKRF